MRAIRLGSSLLLLVAATSYAATLHVCPDGSGDFPTIQAAVDAASSGDTIALCDATFIGPGNRDVRVEEQLEFSGPATIDCEGEGRAFLLYADCGFYGLTFRNGSANSGGAIYAAPPDIGARIFGCRFENNSAVSGGAIHLDSWDLAVANRGEFFVSDTIFLENHTSGSSGVIKMLGVNAHFVGCRFERNTAGGYGGIMHNVNASTLFEECLFVDNEAEGRGGVTSCEYVTFRRCTLVGNRAGAGAHIDLGFDNVASIDHCILAFGRGGGSIVCDEIGEIHVICSDIFGNVGGDWPSCIEDQQDENLSIDPRFCPFDYTLREDSPCAPDHSGDCDLIGALPVACGTTAIDAKSWGSVKALYR